MAPASDIGFYSAVEKAALNVQRNSGSGQAFLNDITKGENVKLDEIKWMGLDDFLKGKKNVTKQEVQDFVQSNRVDVQEVTLSDMRKEAMESLTNMSKDELANTYKQVMSFDIGGEYGRNWYTRKNEVIDEIMNPEMESNYLDFFMQSKNALSAKYDKYQLPGGENYREILLKLPSKPMDINTAAENYYTQFLQRGGQPDWSQLTSAKKQELISSMPDVAINAPSSPAFYSSHFDEPNVLAHIRVNDRVDADGKKMLLIEEVQSDWHQAGREKGYKGKGTLKELPDNYFVQELKTIDGDTIYVVRDKENPGVVLNRDYNKQSAINGVINELNATSAGGVPDAPFKDTWYQLALKRALRYAADNGYDRVGLTTGKQQAERYDLSKQVDELNYKRNDDGTYQLSAQANGRGNMLGESIPEKNLSDYVGKEVAEKIAKNEGFDRNFGGNGSVSQPKDIWKGLSGLDLKIGGEGMKKYYDDVYPKFLEKYGKKWGASVGETQIKTGRGVPGGEPVRFIDITPEMRKSVQKGQPLAAVSSEFTVA